MAEGYPQYKACKQLQINERRVQRWRQQTHQQRDNPYGRKPVERTHRPYNALMPEEQEIMKKMVADEAFVDASCRLLSIKTLEQQQVYISHVTFWSYMCEKDINGPRGIYAKRRKVYHKPDMGKVTGPNQVWCWDISFVKTTIPYDKFYLYALLDSFSRKVISWVVSNELNSDVAQSLWDQGLLNEQLVYSPKADLPMSLSDRGSQMRSHSTQDFFKTLGIDQVYARPRTPNDNPQIEALFSTVKNCPDYPGRFEALHQAHDYFEQFFHWYNHEHYHTQLQMITPYDVHIGRANDILAERQRIKDETFVKRQLYHANSLKNKSEFPDIS